MALMFLARCRSSCHDRAVGWSSCGGWCHFSCSNEIGILLRKSSVNFRVIRSSRKTHELMCRMKKIFLKFKFLQERKLPSKVSRLNVMNFLSKLNLKSQNSTNHDHRLRLSPFIFLKKFNPQKLFLPRLGQITEKNFFRKAESKQKPENSSRLLPSTKTEKRCRGWKTLLFEKCLGGRNRV